MDIRKRIDVFWPYLHAIPEPAFREMKTSAFVAEVLRKAGYEVQEKVGGTTGVVGVLDSGRPGPVAAVRSDMDCLLPRSSRWRNGLRKRGFLAEK